MSEYLPRRVDHVLEDLVRSFPALLLTGPRATGKTTSAERLAGSVVRLDVDEEAAVLEADPDAVLGGRKGPVLIDEWQIAPSVLGAVKRAVDHDSRAGQFLITGSVRADLDQTTWPGTGRLIRVAMFGITASERRGVASGPGFVDRLVVDGPEAIDEPADPPDLRGYVEELLISGFPEPALRLGPDDRELWLESYIDQVVTRDADMLDHGRDPALLRRYFDVLAANTAGVIDEATIVRTAGMDRRTAQGYERLLVGLSLLQVLPAWWSDRLKRLTQRPKRLLVDAALAASALAIDADGMMRDGNVLGRLLETFVVAQIRAEVELPRSKAKLYHLRTEGGRQEIDLIIELPGQRLLGIEVKAGSAPRRQDARHLAWLRDSIGDRFIGGAVLHTGRRCFVLDRGIVAVPIACLWDQGR